MEKPTVFPVPVEMKKLYQTVAENIDHLTGKNIEHLHQVTAKNIDQAVREAIENALTDKPKKRGGRTVNKRHPH